MTKEKTYLKLGYFYLLTWYFLKDSHKILINLVVHCHHHKLKGIENISTNIWEAEVELRYAQVKLLRMLTLAAYLRDVEVAELCSFDI